MAFNKEEKMRIEIHPAIPIVLFLSSFWLFFVPILMFVGWILSIILFCFASDKADKENKFIIISKGK